MAGVDSAGLAEVIQNLVPAFVESRSRPGTLDFPADRAGVIQVRSLSPSPSPSSLLPAPLTPPPSIHL